MKGVWISLCIAVLIVVGSMVSTKHINNVSEEMGRMNDVVMSYLAEENYYEAAVETKKLAQYLEKQRTILDATGNHDELNKIEMNVSEMAGYIDGEQGIDAVSKCRVLDFMFENLPRNYRIKMENIL